MESEQHGQKKRSRFFNKDKPCPTEKTLVFIKIDDERHEGNEENHVWVFMYTPTIN